MSLERKRKFVAAMVFLACHVGMTMAGVVDGQQWVTGLLGIAGLYLGAEAYEGRPRVNS